MKLPNADRAVIDSAKLRDYCLNPLHPEGKHKARVFASTLGLAEGDAETLSDMISAAVLTHEAMPGISDEHGDRFIVDFEIQGLVGMVTIRTAWIVDRAGTIPRLVSCYVKRKQRHG